MFALGTAAAAAAAQRSYAGSVTHPGMAPDLTVTHVFFLGTTPQPWVVIVGNGFGSKPAGQSDDNNSCGQYTNNGDVFGEAFYFTDVGNFTAGAGAPGNSTCVGIVVELWTQHLIVFRFGSAYDSFDRWYVANDDQYQITLLGIVAATGTVSGLS